LAAGGRAVVVVVELVLLPLLPLAWAHWSRRAREHGRSLILSCNIFVYTSNIYLRQQRNRLGDGQTNRPTRRAASGECVMSREESKQCLEEEEAPLIQVLGG